MFGELMFWHLGASLPRFCTFNAVLYTIIIPQFLDLVYDLIQTNRCYISFGFCLPARALVYLCVGLLLLVLIISLSIFFHPQNLNVMKSFFL